jgi:hypothetical protein
MFCVLLNVGCSNQRDKPKDLPALFPCTLTFTQDGAPLDGANISLHSKSKWSVGGVTDENGNVKLVTNGFYDGVPADTYKIVVRKVVEVESNGEVVSRTDVINAKFKKEGTTSLEITISQGNNDQTFDLGKVVNISLPIEP